MKKIRKFVLYGAVFSLLLFCFGCASRRAEPEQPLPPSGPEAAAPRGPQEGVVSNFAAFIPTPRAIAFCGEPVPLESEQVWERFDQQFTMVVYNHSQMVYWLTRAQRDFPWIERLLQRHSLPDDLKYVIVQESNLLPRVWLARIARGRYRKISFYPTGEADIDYQRAVERVLLKLKDLRSRFPDWALAVTAYNCGEKRLKELMRAQKCSDAYELYLPPKNDAYLFRVLAIKAAFHMVSGLNI